MLRTEYSVAGVANYDASGHINYAQSSADYAERIAEFEYRTETDLRTILRRLKTTERQKALLDLWLYDFGLRAVRRKGFGR